MRRSWVPPVFAVSGLAASAILLVDYLRPAPLFCGDGGGCDVVKASAYANLFGVPTPAYGVLFFVTALGLIILGTAKARRALVFLACAGAGASLGFIGLQAFVLGAFCKFCMLADGSALALLVAAVVAQRDTAPPEITFRLVSGSAAMSALGVPLMIGRLFGTPVTTSPPGETTPEVVLREQRPGMATVVEFVDFECPFCRKLHQTMETVIASYGAKVRMVRKQHPLVQLHPHAMTAARAAVCAEDGGRGDDMAEALYAADPKSFTPEGTERMARRIGLDVDAYRACVASTRPTERIAADVADAKTAGVGEEAPVFWIGAVRFRGALPAEAIRAELDKSLK